MIKINDKALSIPPYISTSWKNINTLYTKEKEHQIFLIILLHSGTTIEIPYLDPSIIDAIFFAHKKFLEEEAKKQLEVKKVPFFPKEGKLSFSLSSPFPLMGPVEGAESLGTLLQHNPEQAEVPDLPPEILNKIVSVSSSLGMDLDQMNIPKGEPHCNCVYCQIAKALQKGSEIFRTQEEEEISDADLQFRSWDIKQEGDKLYLVTNPLDEKEHYQVFLGSPVGCTCGIENCEHIRTVLNS